MEAALEVASIVLGREGALEEARTDPAGDLTGDSGVDLEEGRMMPNHCSHCSTYVVEVLVVGHKSRSRNLFFLDGRL